MSNEPRLTDEQAAELEWYYDHHGTLDGLNRWVERLLAGTIRERDAARRATAAAYTHVEARLTEARTKRNEGEPEWEQPCGACEVREYPR